MSHASDQGSSGLPAGRGCPWRTLRRPIILIVDDARENVEVLADCLQFELGFNRSMQHIQSCVSRRSVADEAKTKNLLHG
ncbi:MAG: hypothetical protein ACOZCK_08435 [Pseudomonadota bacterium]